MEKKLNLIYILPLLEMALRRSVIFLWSESDMSAALRTPTAGSEICKKVKDKISNLVIPETLKKRVAGYVLPVQLELVKFKILHEFIFDDVPPEDFYLSIWGQLCWTSSGLIDQQKTAEKLVRLQLIDIEKRYRLACSYCLEDYIPVLWKELPESYKSRFEGDIYPLPENVIYLEYYWAVVMKREEFRLNDILPREFSHGYSTYQSYFEYSACVVNKAAAGYFIQKLTHEEKNGALCRVFRKTCDVFIKAQGTDEGRRKFMLNGGLGFCRSDILYYLLSLMTHKQQMQVLSIHHYIYLLCFQNWPWPSLFLDIAVLVGGIIPESEYTFLLKLMFEYFHIYDVPELIQEFFMRSPINFKKKLAGMVHEKPLMLTYYIFKGDAQTVRVVLEHLDSGEKMKVFSSPHFLKSLCVNKWHLVELCIGQYALSKQDRNVLKDIYKGFRTETTEQMDFVLNEIQWKRLFDVLDGTSVSTNDTKCSGDENLDKTKRTCSEEEDCNRIKKIKIQ